VFTKYDAKRFLIDIVYPNKCPFCDSVIAHNGYYCCTGELELLENSKTDNTIALFGYNEVSMPFVYSIKGGGNGYAISAAAKLISERITQDIDLIACIPTDSARMRERGYNPPALIARELAGITGIARDTKLLIKTRRTQLQKSLTAIERRENMKGVFACNQKCSGNILLIDDVCTTGATLAEAEKVLLESGAGKVYRAVVAMTVRD